MSSDQRGTPAVDLPTLPQGWRWQSLIQLVDSSRGICYGIVQPGKHQPNGVPMVNTGDVFDGSVASEVSFKVSTDLHSKFRRSTLKGGELLVTLVGANFGRVAIAPHRFAGFNCSRAVGVVPVLGDPAYVMFALRSPLARHLMDTWANTTAQPTFNLKDLGNLPVPIPPEMEKASISDFLLSIDDRITLLRETNATLEAIVQALFKSWFVDFDPVCAKMEGRVPEGMDEATAALFPDSFVETELREMPRGWRAGCLADIAKTFKKQVTTPDLLEGIKYVGLEHIPRKSLSLTDWGDAAELESNKSAFATGDILFGKLRPYFHKVVVAPIDGVCSTDILVCQPTQAEHHGVVTMHLFSDELISYADRLSNGAKMPRVNWSDLAQFRITVPPVPVSKAYTETIAPLLRRMRHNTHAAQTLATLRDSLLPRLISGRIRLGHAYAVANLFDVSEVQMSN